MNLGAIIIKMKLKTLFMSSEIVLRQMHCGVSCLILQEVVISFIKIFMIELIWNLCHEHGKINDVSWPSICGLLPVILTGSGEITRSKTLLSSSPTTVVWGSGVGSLLWAGANQQCCHESSWVVIIMGGWFKGSDGYSFGLED